MYLDRIHRRLAYYAELGCAETDDTIPCSEAELGTLERKLGFRLPGVLRELYLLGGKDLGELFGGMDLVEFGQQMARDLRGDAQEILQEADEDPTILEGPAVVVQMDYDGQFSFLRADEGNNPPVHSHNEQEPTFCSCERFSDYLELMLEQSIGAEPIELIRSVEELEGLAASNPKLLHLLFTGGLQFGRVPARIFDFKELRSLNLVNKGLMDLSPRIGELAFLKRLDLARNSLSALPMALTELDGLKELDLADNQLNTVIDVLQKLPGLRYCWLAGNPLSGEEINQLQSELPEVEFVFAET
ncbi:MAG TPA: SMI1/KNR4 family protein [Clostridia bacterium]|nr:SMI1/KNR4 family protein [Clostridia bacterium]